MESQYLPILSKKEYLGLPPSEQEKYVEKKIKEILKMNQNGITIQAIVDKTPFTRPTVTKHLERFVSCREGFKRTFGNLYIYFPNSRAVYPDKTISMEIGNKRTFVGTLINNNYGEFIFIEEMGGEGISGGGFLVKKEEFIIFKEFIEKVFNEVKKDGGINSKKY